MNSKFHIRQFTPSHRLLIRQTPAMPNRFGPQMACFLPPSRALSTCYARAFNGSSMKLERSRRVLPCTTAEPGHCLPHSHGRGHRATSCSLDRAMLRARVIAVALCRASFPPAVGTEAERSAPLATGTSQQWGRMAKSNVLRPLLYPGHFDLWQSIERIRTGNQMNVYLDHTSVCIDPRQLIRIGSMRPRRCRRGEDVGLTLGGSERSQASVQAENEPSIVRRRA